jgi:predicted ArsR family transcriptional regulator
VDTHQIEAIASLDEPVRRRLYEYVVQAGRAVSRDEAAQGAAVQRSLAAFHLDRLADQGLLSVEYRRLSGRTGRGAGRPNKLYRRADRNFEVQLPPRHYELAAEVMAEAIDAAGAPALEALRRAAHQRGIELATPSAEDSGGSVPPSVARTLDVLRSLGFEPHLDEAGEIRLANCPYAALVPQHRETTCSMNLAVIEGLIEGLDAAGITARLDPQPGRCCVAVASSEAPAGT